MTTQTGSKEIVLREEEHQDAFSLHDGMNNAPSTDYGGHALSAEKRLNTK
jgi:hypothetical protein